METDANLRLKGAKLLGKVLAKAGHIGWDLVSWALNDNDARVRQAAAKTLPRLAKIDTRIATIFSERALSDSDSKVRISAVKAIRSLDKDSGRARELILKVLLQKMSKFVVLVLRCCQYCTEKKC